MTGNQVVAGLVLKQLFLETDPHDRVGLKYRTKIIDALNRELIKYEKINIIRYYELKLESANAFKRSWMEFKEGVEIQIPKIAWQFITGHEDLFKPYKINTKHVKSLNALMGSGTAFDSLKVANSLVRAIDDTK